MTSQTPEETQDTEVEEQNLRNKVVSVFATFNLGEGIMEREQRLMEEVLDIVETLHHQLQKALAQKDAEAIQQKYYELAMQAQAIERFFEEDAEKYGQTALHLKFRAFFQKNIQPTLTPKVGITSEDKKAL